jgi:hypothetical protein
MSGTETILLIVLGFSLASMIALFIGRMLWRAAVKVGARRMQRQAPSSLVGLQTERDRLRAEYAMMAQRMGARLEEAKLRLAESMAEVSRHRNRVQHVEVSDAARSAELRQLQARVRELEAALADSTAKEAGLRQGLAAREEALQKLRKKRGYEGHKFTPPAAGAEPVSPAVDPEIRLRQRIDQLREMSKPARQPRPPIAERLAEAERQTNELEAGLQKLEADWTGTPAPSSPAEDVILLPSRPHDPKTGATSPT